MRVYVCNLITQQLTDLHNGYVVISLNLSVVYFGGDLVSRKQTRELRLAAGLCVRDPRRVHMQRGPAR